MFLNISCKTYRYFITPSQYEVEACGRIGISVCFVLSWLILDCFWHALASGMNWPVLVSVDDTLHEGIRVKHTIPKGKCTNRTLHEGKRPECAFGQDWV